MLTSMQMRPGGGATSLSMEFNLHLCQKPGVNYHQLSKVFAHVIKDFLISSWKLSRTSRTARPVQWYSGTRQAEVACSLRKDQRPVSRRADSVKNRRSLPPARFVLASVNLLQRFWAHQGWKLCVFIVYDRCTANFIVPVSVIPQTFMRRKRWWSWQVF